MLSDLRFALDVMEERSHIGLDDERAAAMRRVLFNRISEVEKSLGHPPSVSPVRAATTIDLVSA